MSIANLWEPVVGRPKHKLHYDIIRLRTEGWSYEKINIILKTNIPRQTIATICQKHFRKGRYAIKE